MKKDIHPEWYPECKVFFRGEQVMTVGATVPSSTSTTMALDNPAQPSPLNAVKVYTPASDTSSMLPAVTPPLHW